MEQSSRIPTSLEGVAQPSEGCLSGPRTEGLELEDVVEVRSPHGISKSALPELVDSATGGPSRSQGAASKTMGRLIKKYELVTIFKAHPNENASFCCNKLLEIFGNELCRPIDQKLMEEITASLAKERARYRQLWTKSNRTQVNFERQNKERLESIFDIPLLPMNLLEKLPHSSTSTQIATSTKSDKSFHDYSDRQSTRTGRCSRRRTSRKGP